MCTGLIGHCFILIIGVTGRLALHVYGADWALLYSYNFFMLMIGVTGLGSPYIVFTLLPLYGVLLRK